MYFTGIIATALLFSVGSNVFSVATAKSTLVCQGVEVKLRVYVEEVLKYCLKQQHVKNPTELPDHKKACFGRCILNRNDALSQKGVPNNEEMARIITESFPKEQGAQYVAAVVKCSNDFAPKINPLAKGCDSYEDLSNCLIDSYVKLCIRETKPSSVIDENDSV